jgi:hypothetical protein
MRLPKICIVAAVVGLLLCTVAPALAQPNFHANMALHPETQNMYLAVKTQVCGFQGYFTITPESLVVPGYNNQIHCDSICGPDYVCINDFEVQVVAGLEVGSVVTFVVEIFQSDGQLVAILDDELEVQAMTGRDVGFGYRDDCVPFVPGAVAQDGIYCVWLCHRTYIIPIICPPPIDDTPVFRIRPGCNQYIGYPNACAVDTCSNNASEDVLSWHVTVINPEQCLAFLVIIYCDANPGCACIEGPDWVLPVELATFDALAGNGYVDLSWRTASELDNDHFDIMRKAGNQDWIAITRGIQGHGTTAEPQSYTYRDAAVINDVSYEYMLVSVDINGERHSYPDLTATATPHAFEVPLVYELTQNFPNPFNSSTSFEFALPQEGYVNLKIHDLLGREVTTLIDGTLGAQRYRLTWNANGLPSGVYLYTLNAGTFTQTRKMLFVK